MSVANFVPQIWSQKLNLAFRKSMIFSNLVNRDYEGEISAAGDTVKITAPDTITVNNYAGTVTYGTPTSTQLSLVVDQKKYWAFKVDDVDKRFANVDLLNTYTTEGGVVMADAVDQYLAGLYTAADASNIIVKAAYNASNIYAAFVNAGKLLDQNNVPRTGRWVVVSPSEFALLLNAPEFIKASQLGDAVVQSGALGEVAGFRVYMSNNLVAVTDGTNVVRHCLFGTNAAITFANALTEMEALRLEGQFGDGIRALMLYGAKVIKPKSLGDLRIQVS